MPRIRSCIAGAVALVAVSCQDHSSPIAAPTPISAQFLDAMHGGGNPHFFLLPPFVSTPDLTKETFESGLKPSVRITEMTADGQAFAACTNEQIAYLPASEFTQLKAYAAFWRPANYSNVAAPCIYRLQVEVLGTKASPGPVLGFADVQVISKTTIKYLKTGEYIPLPKDLTLPFWFFIGQGAVFYAQSGGTDACRVDRDCVEAVVTPSTQFEIPSVLQRLAAEVPSKLGPHPALGLDKLLAASGKGDLATVFECHGLAVRDPNAALKQGVFEPLSQLSHPKEDVRYLVIDALDRLQVDAPAFRMGWLPESLPAHVHVLLSATPGPMLHSIQTRLPIDSTRPRTM